MEIGEKLKKNLTLNKKLFVHAAMIVPGCALRTRAEVPPLKNGLHLMQASSAHRKSVIRLD